MSPWSTSFHSLLTGAATQLSKTSSSPGLQVLELTRFLTLFSSPSTLDALMARASLVVSAISLMAALISFAVSVLLSFLSALSTLP